DVLVPGAPGRAGAGPDWTQALVGSEGTLAVLTQATLRVRPAPETRLLRGFEFARLTAGLEGIRRVLQRDLRPAVVRLYDELDSWMALRGGGHAAATERTLPHQAGASLEGEPAGSSDFGDDGLIGRLRTLMPGRGNKKQLLREAMAAALDRPRLLNALVDAGAARLGRRGCLLVVGVEGPERRAQAEARLVFAELERAG